MLGAGSFHPPAQGAPDDGSAASCAAAAAAALCCQLDDAEALVRCAGAQHSSKRGHDLHDSLTLDCTRSGAGCTAAMHS